LPFRLLTNNRSHFRKLHLQSPAHEGIIAFTKDDSAIALTTHVDQAIQAHQPLAGKLVQVYRPSSP
jgi:hypothetical protein